MADPELFIILQQASVHPSEQQQSLVQSLCGFYRAVRFPQKDRILAMERQFSECQARVVQVVEFRKDLEWQLKLEQIKQNHNEQISALVERLALCQDSISQLVELCHQRENQILQLKTTLYQRASAQRQAKSSREDTAQLHRISDSIQELRVAVQQIDHIGHFAKGGEAHHSQHQSYSQLKVELRNKESMIESKLQLLRIRQTMQEQSKTIAKKHMDSLKQSNKVYEQVLAKIIEAKVANKLARKQSAHQTNRQAEQLEYLCRKASADYQRQLTLAQVAIESLKEQNKNMKEAECGYKTEIERLKSKIRELDQNRDSQREEREGQYLKMGEKLKAAQEQQLKMRQNYSQSQSRLVQAQRLLSEMKLKMQQMQKQLIAKEDERLTIISRLQQGQDKTAHKVMEIENRLATMQKQAEGKDKMIEQIRSRQKQYRVISQQAQKGWSIKQSQLQKQLLQAQRKVTQLQQLLALSQESQFKLMSEVKQQQILGTLQPSEMTIIQQKLEAELSRQWQQSNKQIEPLLESVVRMVRGLRCEDESIAI